MKNYPPMIKKDFLLVSRCCTFVVRHLTNITSDDSYQFLLFKDNAWPGVNSSPACNGVATFKGQAVFIFQSSNATPL
jgi:hypothetical protein